MLNLLKKSIIISTVIASSLYSNDNVKLSTDGTGDFLLAPLYIAQGDICSRIKVMNTNEYSSILAKVTVRERIASHEVDLPILLSPGDVWEGNICQINNKVILSSTDDSNHPSAKDILRKGIDLYAHSSMTSYRESDYNKGHVELNGKLFELNELAPDKQVRCVISHSDGMKDEILLNHSYNKSQIEWFKSGSALNVLRNNQ